MKSYKEDCLKEEWKKIDNQIEMLITNPNHIFKNTNMDDWLNNAAYDCKCTYFDRPTEDEEDVDETTLDQERWDNILLRDFDFAEWKIICDDEFYPKAWNYYKDKFDISKIEKFLPTLHEIIKNFKCLYDDDTILEKLYNYINGDFKISSRYILMNEKQKKEHSILVFNKPLLKYFV